MHRSVGPAALSLTLWLGGGATARAQTYSAPWIVFGDSLTTGAVHEGIHSDPRLLPWPLITAERGVVFNSLGGPGAAMGQSGNAHYNSAAAVNAISRVCGLFNYCAGVVLQAAINDWAQNVPWQAQFDATARVLDWAEAKDRRVLMLDAIFDQTAEGGGAAVNAAGLTLAEIRNNRFLMCYARGPDVCVFALRPPALSSFNASYYQSDGRHLRPAGWRQYANWVEAAAADAGLF